MRALFLLYLGTGLLLANTLKFQFGTQDFPPYHYSVDGSVSGPIVNVINAVCAEMQTECTFQIFPWARTQNMAKSGLFDGLFVLGKSKEREKWLAFTHPIVTAEYGLFVETSKPFTYNSPQDIRGKTIAVYGPSNTSRSLSQLKKLLDGNLQIDMRPDDESGFKKLSLKRVDAVYSNKHVGEALVRKLNLQNIRYANSAKTVQYHVGFTRSKNGEANAARFNQAYEKLLNTGRIKQILSEHFLTPANIR